MNVYEAVDSRRAVRAFVPEPVPKPVLERVVQAAARAPSSGNLQPWRVFVVAGEPLAELKRRATARALAGDPGDEREYPMYPDGLGGSPYVDRFNAAANQRYQALGIDRNAPDRPSKVAALNTNAFGAPVVLFCYLDPAMGPGQWADAGMYLQTVMLLLRDEGLHSCPQVMWTMYHRTVSDVVRAKGSSCCAVSPSVTRTRPCRAYARGAPRRPKRWRSSGSDTAAVIVSNLGLAGVLQGRSSDASAGRAGPGTSRAPGTYRVEHLGMRGPIHDARQRCRIRRPRREFRGR